MTSIASEIWSSPAQPVQHAAAWAFTEPPVLRARIDAARALHAGVARTVADLFTAAGAEMARPQAAFYFYPDFASHRERLARDFGVDTSSDLAGVLLRDHNVAVLPGSAFGDDEHTLTIRVATSLLYGDDDQQRSIALEHRQPETLPWIEPTLDRLNAALSALTRAG